MLRKLHQKLTLNVVDLVQGTSRISRHKEPVENQGIRDSRKSRHTVPVEHQGIGTSRKPEHKGPIENQGTIRKSMRKGQVEN